MKAHAACIVTMWPRPGSLDGYAKAGLEEDREDALHSTLLNYYLFKKLHYL